MNWIKVTLFSPAHRVSLLFLYSLCAWHPGFAEEATVRQILQCHEDIPDFVKPAWRSTSAAEVFIHKDQQKVSDFLIPLLALLGEEERFYYQVGSKGYELSLPGVESQRGRTQGHYNSKDRMVYFPATGAALRLEEIGRKEYWISEFLLPGQLGAFSATNISGTLRTDSPAARAKAVDMLKDRLPYLAEPGNWAEADIHSRISHRIASELIRLEGNSDSLGGRDAPASGREPNQVAHQLLSTPEYKGLMERLILAALQPGATNDQRNGLLIVSGDLVDSHSGKTMLSSRALAKILDQSGIQTREAAERKATESSQELSRLHQKTREINQEMDQVGFRRNREEVAIRDKAYQEGPARKEKDARQAVEASVPTSKFMEAIRRAITWRRYDAPSLFKVEILNTLNEVESILTPTSACARIENRELALEFQRQADRLRSLRAQALIWGGVEGPRPVENVIVSPGL